MVDSSTGGDQQIALGQGASGSPAGPAAIAVQGVEVTQSIQDLANSVSLIRGKPAVVRFYLTSIATISRPLEGELLWNAPGQVPAALRSDNKLAPGPLPAEGMEALRARADLSLNFLLPAESLGAQKLELRLGRLLTEDGNEVQVSGRNEVGVDLRPDVPLRIRVVGLRYRDENGTAREPADADFEFIRSWLARAYPVARVEWSQIIVDANFRAPFSEGAFGTAVQANLQLAAIRAADMAGGAHKLTHYYGLVSDSAGLMRGRAFGIPLRADPTVVASGPAGESRGWNGDTDRSYADWYCGHELGHTFGRFHPGFPPADEPGGQDASDSGFPYHGGGISDQDPRYFGFDLGDAALGLPMRSLSPASCHDIMTYMPEQWLSAYTYEAIYRRLLEEATL